MTFWKASSMLSCEMEHKICFSLSMTALAAKYIRMQNLKIKIYITFHLYFNTWRQKIGPHDNPMYKYILIQRLKHFNENKNMKTGALCVLISIAIYK